MNRLSRFERVLFGLLIAMTVAKGVVWIAVLDIWKVADEPAHFDNVQYRAENHWRQPIENGEPMDRVLTPTSSNELKRSWQVSQAFWREKFLPDVRSVPAEEELRAMAKDPTNRKTSGQMPAINYPGVYYNLATIPYLAFRHHSILARVMAIRMLSLLFGVLAVSCTFFVARRAVHSPELAFAASAIVALQPMASQMTAAVNNDAGIIGICGLAFLLQVRMLSKAQSEIGMVDGALLAAVTVLAIFTKTQGLAMIPGSLFVLLAQLRRRWTLPGRFAPVVAFVVVAAILYFAPHLWRVVPPATVASSAPHVSLFSLGLKFPGWFLGELHDNLADRMIRQFWGQFGWLDYALEGRWFTALAQTWPLFILGLVALLSGGLRFGKEDQNWWSRPVIYFAMATTVLAVSFIFACEFYGENVIKAYGFIQGRNFLFALPAFAVVLVASLGALVPERWRSLMAAMIVSVALAINVGGLLTVIGFLYVG